MNKPAVLVVHRSLGMCESIAKQLQDIAIVYVRWYREIRRDRKKSLWVSALWCSDTGSPKLIDGLPPPVQVIVIHYSDSKDGLPEIGCGALVPFSAAGLDSMPRGEHRPGAPVRVPVRSPDDTEGLAAIQKMVRKELLTMPGAIEPTVETARLRSLSRLELLFDLERTTLLGQDSSRRRAADFEIGDEKNQRQKAWHAIKNFLQDAAQRNGESYAGGALELLLDWETSVGGQHSGKVLEIINLFKQHRFDEARVVAETYYSAFLDAMRGGYAVRLRTATNMKRGTVSVPIVRILLVDDSTVQLNYIANEIERLAIMFSGFAIELVRCNASRPFTSALERCKSNSFHGAIVDWQLGEICDGKRVNGVDLVSRLLDIFPSISCVVMTGHDVFELMNDETASGFRPISKSDPSAIETAIRVVLQDVRRRAETPFFTALQEYSRRPVSVLHALPISGGRAIRGNPWLSAFGDFYGENIFHAESSSTQPPLDSLLSPRGAILRAEKLAAKVFGAQRARFVTNGTSTANKIVHQAMLLPGDIVLIDRTCHKSHHYGLVLVGAVPVYLNSQPVYLASNLSSESEFSGFCGPVSSDTICGMLRKNPTAKMLCLSNCTFDGFIHDPLELIGAVFRTLRELRLSDPSATDPAEFVFLFDEAWFGYARFSRTLRRFTAMHAAATEFDGLRARVYSTQSTHKTLVAFRQGSMILISDPKFESFEFQFEEALFTHTTTSPSYQILASLDVGRMWADLDGDSVCRELDRIADGIRSSIRTDQRLVHMFHALELSDMNLSDDVKNCVLDRSKVTIYIKDKRITGAMVNERLMERDVQFNKFTNNTVLLLLTPGTTESVAGHVIAALRELAAEISDSALRAHRRIVDSSLFADPVEFNPQVSLRDAYFGKAIADWGQPSAVALDKLSEAYAALECSGLAGGADCYHYISQRFVIPYPPGFPILVPGQLVTRKHIDYLRSLATKEIHGVTDGKLVVWRVALN